MNKVLQKFNALFKILNRKKVINLQKSYLIYILSKNSQLINSYLSLDFLRIYSTLYLMEDYSV